MSNTIPEVKNKVFKNNGNINPKLRDRKIWAKSEDTEVGSVSTPFAITILFFLKAWSHRRTDMYWGENGLKYAEFGYPVTKFISSASQSSRDRHVEPGS